jgi:hypothetical protein
MSIKIIVFLLPTLIKVYPVGIAPHSGELAINSSTKQHITVSQKGSWGVSLCLHFSHTSVCSVILGVVHLKVRSKNILEKPSSLLSLS